MDSRYNVIVKTLPKDSPRNFEMSAALIIAEYFKSDIVFLRPIPLKSPDLNIRGEVWELKSPIGKSKNTIANNFKSARKQSINIVIDLRNCKLDERNAISRIKFAISKRRRRKGKVLVINKRGKVLDFSNDMGYHKINRY